MVRVSRFSFLRMGMSMCLSTVEGNQMAVTRVSQCFPDVGGESCSPYPQ